MLIYADFSFTVCAFHLKLDDIPLDQNVGKWAVNVISLSRTKRHLDRAALMTFWEKIDKYSTLSAPIVLNIRCICSKESQDVYSLLHY